LWTYRPDSFQSSPSRGEDNVAKFRAFSTGSRMMFSPEMTIA